MAGGEIDDDNSDFEYGRKNNIKNNASDLIDIVNVNKKDSLVQAKRNMPLNKTSTRKLKDASFQKFKKKNKKDFQFSKKKKKKNVS